MKKIYSEKDGIKTIEEQFWSPYNSEWFLSSKTVIQNDNITTVRKNALTQDELQKITQKQNDGTWKTTEQKIRTLDSLRGYAIDTIDVKTGEIIDTKIARFNIAKDGNDVLLRKTRKEADEAGNKVINTYKNGKLYSTKRTTIQPDGTRHIVIEYAKWSGKTGQTIINITKDGTKKVVEEAKTIFQI